MKKLVSKKIVAVSLVATMLLGSTTVFSANTNGSHVNPVEGETYTLTASQLSEVVTEEGYEWKVELAEKGYAELTCEKKAHFHEEDCYNQVCETPLHVHEEDCLTLSCTEDLHKHTADCAELECGLEIHKHTKDCKLVCKKYEHTHTDKCYLIYDQLVTTCEGHNLFEHTKDCYVLECETAEHTHTEGDCYGLVCEYKDVEEHTHNVLECYTLSCAKEVHAAHSWMLGCDNYFSCGYMSPEEYAYHVTHGGFSVNRECGLSEHTHSTSKCAYTVSCDQAEHTHASLAFGRGGCYDWKGNLVCTTAEHTHSAENGCPVTYTCTTPEHTHSDACGAEICKKCNVVLNYHSHNDETCARTYTCTKELHTHGDDCFTQSCGYDYEHKHGDACEDLTCTTVEHTHSTDLVNGCYQVETIKKLICIIPEHVHEGWVLQGGCYSLTNQCGKVYHPQHTALCYSEPLCGETHTYHGTECYDVICGKELHPLHTEDCYEVICDTKMHVHCTDCYNFVEPTFNCTYVKKNYNEVTNGNQLQQVYVSVTDSMGAPVAGVEVEFVARDFTGSNAEIETLVLTGTTSEAGIVKFAVSGTYDVIESITVADEALTIDTENTYIGYLNLCRTRTFEVNYDAPAQPGEGSEGLPTPEINPETPEVDPETPAGDLEEPEVDVEEPAGNATTIIVAGTTGEVTEEVAEVEPVAGTDNEITVEEDVVDIEDEETPLADGETEIEDEEVPLAADAENHNNGLLYGVLGVVAAIALFVVLFIKRKKDSVAE